MAAKTLSNISLHHEEARLLRALQAIFSTETYRFCTLNEAVGRCIRTAADAELGAIQADEIARNRNYKPCLPYERKSNCIK